MFGSLGGLSAFGGSKGIGGLLGGGGDPGKKQWAQILQQYQLAQGQQRGAFGNALALLKKGQGAIGKGYDTALNQTNQMAAGAKQGVLDREKQNLGSLKAGLAGSGTLGGTLGANLERGVYSDTNRSLSQVDSLFAQHRANLATERAQLEAGGYGAMAGLFQSQSGQNTALTQSLIGSIAGQQHSDPNAWMGNLVQGGMNLLPFLV